MVRTNQPPLSVVSCYGQRTVGTGSAVYGSTGTPSIRPAMRETFFQAFGTTAVSCAVIGRVSAPTLSQSGVEGSST